MKKQPMRQVANWIFHSRLLFAITLAVIFYGLFLVPDNDLPGRALNQVWNLGHIGAFLICWTYVFNLFPRVQRLSLLKLAMLVIVSTLVIAEVIEIVQGWIGRDDEWQDVWDSTVGSGLALAFTSVQVRDLSKRSRLVWHSLSIVALVAIPWSIWSNLADALIVQRQFPVISDFSTPFELTRWRGKHADIEIKSSPDGHAYLSVRFRPGKYSTLTLKYFHRNWQAYHNLVLDLHSPQSKSYPVILRINDNLHKQHHFALSDRFNRKILLRPGQQQVVIPLSAIRNAPRTRKMDMRHLEELDLFTMDSEVYHYLDIQKIYLE